MLFFPGSIGAFIYFPYNFSVGRLKAHKHTAIQNYIAKALLLGGIGIFLHKYPQIHFHFPMSLLVMLFQLSFQFAYQWAADSLEFDAHRMHPSAFPYVDIAIVIDSAGKNNTFGPEQRQSGNLLLSFGTCEVVRCTARFKFI